MRVSQHSDDSLRGSMGALKLYWRKNAKSLIEYIDKDGGKSNDLVSAEGCTPETAASDFKTTAKTWHKKGKYEALHIIQSWNPEESKMLPVEKFHEMGRSIVATYFKGHEFVVKTHTDTDNTHNHIVVNVVNFETGKMIENKKHHLYRLRDLSDKLCLENGLSIINKDAKDREAKLPDKVLRMDRFNRKSYLLDIKQKADLARRHSTNYGEYASILGELGVTVEVQNKNITYFYPGLSRGKRGSKIGKLYDKMGLEEAFKTNNELFKARPELRYAPAEQISSLKNQTTTSHSKLEFIPLEEMRRARSGNILEYCKGNKIQTEPNEKGQQVLKARPFVVVTEREWINTRNKTRGSLIEFVAGHEKVSFLEAVSRINNSPRLRLLEAQYGETKRSYTSFYISKSDSLPWPEATKKLGSFLAGLGIKGSTGNTLLKNQLAQVGKNGMIRLFPMGESTGAIEFSPSESNTLKQKKVGKISSPFISIKGSGDNLLVFSDPMQAIKAKGMELFENRSHRTGLLVLLEPNHKPIDRHVAENKNVKNVQLVMPPGKLPPVFLDFFNNLKHRYAQFGIEVNTITQDRIPSREGPEMSL